VPHNPTDTMNTEASTAQWIGRGRPDPHSLMRSPSIKKTIWF
jgi:hypothetical protein